MLAGILFVLLIIAVAVAITVDVVRTPADGPYGQADWHALDTVRAVSGPPGGTGVSAFLREPARRDTPVPSDAGPPRRREDVSSSRGHDEPPATWPTARHKAHHGGLGPADADSFDGMDDAASALDQMRREISRLAASEAALRGKLSAVFVNLAHRSQSLMERQIRLIENLEYGEQDGPRLAQLSRMSRIAMRMYRTAQNLLVLAGQEPPTGWSEPVTLVQLVRAALSEIEDSQRVSFDVQPDIAVGGHAANDVVHLLVELTENATSFSAADMPVHITGHMLNTGGALIDVTDRGIGMAAREMAYANRQLENPPTTDIDVSRWMGLHVVARLAARHGIRVRLNQAESGGLTALVWLPDEILIYHGAAAEPGLAAAEPGHAAAEPGHAAAEQPVTAARSAGFASARMDTQGAAVPRHDPAWSARSPRPTAQAEPPTAVRLSGSGLPDAPGEDAGVIVPHAPSPARTGGLPIFDEVESRLSRGPGTSPVAPNRSAAVAHDRLTGSQRGVSEGRAEPGGGADAGGQDRS